MYSIPGTSTVRQDSEQDVGDLPSSSKEQPSGGDSSHRRIQPTAYSRVKKSMKRTSAALRHGQKIDIVDKLATVSQAEIDIRRSYYKKKIELRQEEINLKKKDVASKENILNLLESWLKK